MGASRLPVLGSAAVAKAWHESGSLSFTIRNHSTTLLMACSTCEREIPDNLGVCPYCGRPQDPITQNKRILTVFAVLTAMLAAAFVLQALVD